MQVLVVDVKDTKDKAESFARRSGFNFPVLLDSDGETAKRYAPPGVLPDLPRDQIPIASNLIIDRKGRVRFYSLLDSRNFDARLTRLRAKLNELMAGPP